MSGKIKMRWRMVDLHKDNGKYYKSGQPLLFIQSKLEFFAVSSFLWFWWEYSNTRIDT